jgi:hypothetical protein
MKNLLIASCLTVALISCKEETGKNLIAKNNSVSITYNKIKQLDSLKLLKPVNGKYDYLFERKTNTIPTIKITIDKPQLIMLDRTTLFVAPNETCTINEINPYENINEYSGANSTGQEFLNSLKTYNNDYLAIKSIKKNSIEQGYKKIDSVFLIDYNRLDSLASKELVSTAFQQTVKQKLNFDKAYTKARALFRGFMRTVKDTTNFNNEFNQNNIALFNKLYKEYSVNSSISQSNLNWYEYTKSYICTSNIIKTKQSFKYNRDDQFSNHENFLSVAKQLLNKEGLEYFTARYLFDDFLNSHYSKSLVFEYEKFKKEYPNSVYLPYLIKNIDVITEYPKRVKQPISSKIKFVENCNSINTLEKLMNLTKGKNTYLVFWKDDFSVSKIDFNALLKSRPFFKKHNINIVYLSLNELTNNENAKDIIHYYNLEGKHISANSELLNDINSKTKSKVPYPGYMIINKDGKIVDSEAVWPRRENYFEKELIEKLML